MIPALTQPQKDALKAAILAEPNVSAFLASGDDGSIATYYNGVSGTAAWTLAQRADMYGAMTIASFDNLTAGKRDAWRMMLDYAPADFRKGKFRSAVTDIWGAAAATTILNACATRPATIVEALFGGTDRTESSVTAKVLVTEGMLTGTDIAQILRG